MRSHTSPVFLQLTHRAAGGKQFRLASVLLFSVTCAYCSASTSETIGPTSTKCQTDVIGVPTSMSALGGQIEAMVRTSPECAWSATTNATWLQVQPASGQGEVAITLQVAENKLPNERIGAIHVNGLDVMLAQAAFVPPPPPPPAPTPVPPAPAPTPTPPAPTPTPVTAGPDPDACTAGPDPDACTAGPEPDACTAGPEPDACAAGPEPDACAADPEPDACAAGPDPDARAADPDPTPVPPAPTPTPTPPASPPPSVQQFSGTVSGLTGTCPVLSFTVGGRLVQTDDGTEFIQGNCKHLSNGMDIGVTGTLTGGAVHATQVQLKGR